MKFSLIEETNELELTDDEKRLFQDLLSEEEDSKELSEFGLQRRQFLKQILAPGGGILAFQVLGGQQVFASSLSERKVSEIPDATIENSVKVAFKVNGEKKFLEVDSRMSLLDSLRERLRLTGSKKGCDHGQCGACTVIVDGRRVLSCLTLTATCEGKTITTIEGLAKGKDLHPVQAAFLKHDGFQCGFCTPGQICSTVALMNEAKKGELSYVTPDVHSKAVSLLLSDNKIRERMSGNICRCGAYSNIVAAIREVQGGKGMAGPGLAINRRSQSPDSTRQRITASVPWRQSLLMRKTRLLIN